MRFGFRVLPEREAAVYFELCRSLLANIPLSILGNLVLATLVAPIALAGPQRFPFIVWASLMYATCLFRLAVSRTAAESQALASMSSPGAPSEEAWGLFGELLRRAVLFSSLSGLLWGAFPIVVMWEPADGSQLYLAFLLAGIPAGALGTTAYVLSSFFLVAAPILLSVASVLLIAQPTGWVETSVIVLVYLMFLSRAGCNIHALFRESIRFRLSREALTTQLSKQQVALAAKNNELDAALADAQRATVAKGEFLAKMSHEVRTPVNGIIGMTTLALDQVMDSEQREALSTVKESAEHLLHLVNDILDHSKMEAGKIILEYGCFDNQEACEKLFRLFGASAQQRGVKLSIEIDERAPRFVVGDVHRLGQILNNLISNALKFTPEGGRISLKISSDMPQQNIAMFSFEVVDSGVGIPGDQQLRIFDAFVQADSSVTRTYGGTGLGLTISANLAALMGGLISLESKVGQGSTFCLKLPLSVASEAEVAKAKLQGALPRSESGVRLIRRPSAPDRVLRVLVAEDNPINQKIVQRVLEKEGFEVVLAENGLRALSLLAQVPVDIILMDCQMPCLDGYEASRRIRDSENSKVATLPIIALTAHAMEGDRERCLEAGMTEYISKPFDRAHLIATVRRLVPVS